VEGGEIRGESRGEVLDLGGWGRLRRGRGLWGEGVESLVLWSFYIFRLTLVPEWCTLRGVASCRPSITGRCIMRKLKNRLTIGQRLVELLVKEGGSTSRPASQLAIELGVALRSLEITIQRLYGEGYLVRRDESRTLRLATRSVVD
jgi:hypothetical protein